MNPLSNTAHSAIPQLISDTRISDAALSRPATPAQFNKPSLPNDSGRRGLLLRNFNSTIGEIRKASTAKEAEGAQYGALLTINWDAVRHNYRLAKGMIGTDATPSVVLKADGYGFDAAKMAAQLSNEGCRHFFVAHYVEAIAVKDGLVKQSLIQLDENGLPDHHIFVLHGPMPGAEQAFVDNNIVPVLNSLSQVNAWAECATQNGRRLPAILQVDTGMHRAGISPEDLGVFLEQIDRFGPNVDVRYIMSHLACSGDAESQANEKQFAELQNMSQQIRAHYPDAGTSLAASSGVFLAPKFHGNLVRFGGLLHGMEPVSGPNPMEPVIRLEAKIQNIRQVPLGEGVGYGLTGAANRSRMIATLAIGFADGLPRTLGNKGKVYIGDSEAPIVGKISMDMITVDITNIKPENLGLKEGDMAEIINQKYTLDHMARDAGTIPADITCGFGNRFFVNYVHDGAPLVNLDMENITPDKLAAINDRAQARHRAMENIANEVGAVSDEPEVQATPGPSGSAQR